MSRKRRMFDIEMPVETPDAAPVPAGSEELETKSAGARRGPMASAIGDAADALRRRQDQEAQIRAENDALAHEFVALQKAGLVVRPVPLDTIRTEKLIRDRETGADPQIDDLVVSIREVGLSNPIRLEDAGEGGYELIQGFRRLQAYRSLLAETGDATRWGAIPAIVTPSGPGLEELYRRMVDENLVRKDISFAEMAALARDYAADPQTAAGDVGDAVRHLYASAGRQKQSYVRRFAQLLEHLDKYLSHPAEIPRALGLAVLARIEAESQVVAEIACALSALRNPSPEEELAVLRRYADATVEAGDKELSPRGQIARSEATRTAKTTFRLPRPEGEAKCTAAVDRLELRLKRDFSAIDRRRLEAAVVAFFDTLDR